jgi:hypothetical protein
VGQGLLGLVLALALAAPLIPSGFSEEPEYAGETEGQILAEEYHPDFFEDMPDVGESGEGAEVQSGEGIEGQASLLIDEDPVSRIDSQTTQMEELSQDGEESSPGKAQTPSALSDGEMPTVCSYCGSGELHGHADASLVAGMNFPQSPAGDGFVGMLGEEREAWDLRYFVTDMAITDEYGYPMTDEILPIDLMYMLTVSFSEYTGSNGQFAYNQYDRLVYHLPPGFVAADQFNGRPIAMESGTVIGYYAAGLDGQIEVWFDDVDIDGNPTPDTLNFIDYYADAAFWLEIETQYAGIENEMLTAGMSEAGMFEMETDGDTQPAPGYEDDDSDSLIDSAIGSMIDETGDGVVDEDSMVDGEEIETDRLEEGETVFAPMMGFSALAAVIPPPPTRTEIILYKEDEDHPGRRLVGAQFTLYMATPEDSYYGEGAPTEAITFGGRSFYKLCDAYMKGYTEYRFASDDGWITAANENIYLIIETAAPALFMLPSEQPGGEPSDDYTLIALSAGNQAYWAAELNQPVRLVGDEGVLITNKKRACEITRPTDPQDMLAGKIILDKTVYGKPFMDWFANDSGLDYSELSSLVNGMTFSLYPTERDGGDWHGEPIMTVKLNEEGKIIFDIAGMGLSAGWYAVVEDLSGKAEREFEQSETLYIFAGPNGAMSSVGYANTGGMYSIEYTGGFSWYIKLIYSNGFVYDEDRKPDGSGQTLTTECFDALLPDKTKSISFCADLGAHNVYGNYMFDENNHNFSPTDMLHLIAAFDYINDYFAEGEGLLDNPGKAVAQIVLWNIILNVDGNAGYAEEWYKTYIAPDDPDKENVTMVKIEGNDSWYTPSISNLVDDIITNRDYYISRYIQKTEYISEETYVTGVVFIIGEDERYSSIDQQRQIIVLFGESVKFNNTPKVWEGSILPSVGGGGRGLYTVAGSAAIALAGYLLLVTGRNQPIPCTGETRKFPRRFILKKRRRGGRFIQRE